MVWKLAYWFGSERSEGEGGGEKRRRGEGGGKKRRRGREREEEEKGNGIL